MGKEDQSITGKKRAEPEPEQEPEIGSTKHFSLIERAINFNVVTTNTFRVKPQAPPSVKKFQPNFVPRKR